MVRSKHSRGQDSHKLSGSRRWRSPAKFCTRGRSSPVHRRPLHESRFNRFNRSYRKKNDEERHPRHIERRRTGALQSSRNTIYKVRKDFSEPKSKKRKLSRSRSPPSSTKKSPTRVLSFSRRVKSEPKEEKRERVKEIKQEGKTKPERKLVDAESKITESRMPKSISRWLPLPVIPLIYSCCTSLAPTWCGTLAIGQSVKCQIVMEPLPGHYYQFSHLEKNNLRILGGIKRSAVWECMQNIKMRGKKKVAIVLIKPLSIHELESYNKIFNYFNVRRQIGHIGYRTKNMSFFLLLPLPARKSLKSILKSFQSESSGQTIWPRINTNSLVGIMLLQPHDDDVQLYHSNSFLPFLSAQTIHIPPFMFYDSQTLHTLASK